VQGGCRVLVDVYYTYFPPNGGVCRLLRLLHCCIHHFIEAKIHSFTHSLTHSLTLTTPLSPKLISFHSHSHIPLFPHLPTPPLTHSLTHSLNHSITHLFRHTLTHSLTMNLPKIIPPLSQISIYETKGFLLLVGYSSTACVYSMLELTRPTLSVSSDALSFKPHPVTYTETQMKARLEQMKAVYKVSE
jgi:hypothetical protein